MSEDNWAAEGNCAKPPEEWVRKFGKQVAMVAWKNYFYPEDGPGADRAARVCWGVSPLDPDAVECPVRRRCLQHAIEYNETLGVFGGYGQRDRVRVRKDWQKTGAMRDLSVVKVLVRKAPRQPRQKQLQSTG